jgi:uncharacterized protein YlxW (UPF0749 family)
MRSTILLALLAVAFSDVTLHAEAKSRHEVMTSRLKRATTISALEELVQQLAQKVDELTSRLTAVEDKEGQNFFFIY